MADLDEVGIAELIQTVSKTGYYKVQEEGTSNLQYAPAVLATGEIANNRMRDRQSINYLRDQASTDQDVKPNNSYHRRLFLAAELIKDAIAHKVDDNNGGEVDKVQVWYFKDSRTGATNIPVPNSGFRINQWITIGSAKEIVIKTKSTPTDLTVGGITVKKGTQGPGVGDVISTTVKDAGK